MSLKSKKEKDLVYLTYCFNKINDVFLYLYQTKENKSTCWLPLKSKNIKLNEFSSPHLFIWR